MRKNRRAQTIIEYFVIFVVITFAVVTAGVLGTRGKDKDSKGKLQQAFEGFINKASQAMNVGGSGGK